MNRSGVRFPQAAPASLLVTALNLTDLEPTSIPPSRFGCNLRCMASLRVRQRKDGSSYTAVLYALDGKQTSSSFNDHREAVDFQQLVNRVGPVKATEIWRPRPPAADGHTVASWCAYHIDHLTGVNQATRAKYRRYVANDI